MAKQPKTKRSAPGRVPGGQTGGSGNMGTEDRRQRLEAALRENLKRRKAQTRARAKPAKPHEPDS